MMGQTCPGGLVRGRSKKRVLQIRDSGGHDCRERKGDSGAIIMEKGSSPNVST